jgi:multicomponent Na+:H+ antiporter subunit B
VTRRARTVVFLVAACGLAAVLLRALANLPEFGHFRGEYGLVLNAVTIAERAALNVVSAVNFDYRAFDTLGEEFILFTAVAGAALLLRAERHEEEVEAPRDVSVDRPLPPPSSAVRALSLAWVGALLLVGVYTVVHGHLSPGGGFQGGVILATAAILVYLADELTTFRRIAPELLVEAAESAGAAGYAITGAMGLLFGTSFLENVLPLGEPGDLLSAGQIALLNVVVGLEVAGALVLLWIDFLRQTLMLRPREER